jgi:hypothetical protein
MRPLSVTERNRVQQKTDVHENVDIRLVVATLELKEKCPGWDSNPHCMVFETIISAGWITRAMPARY